MTRTLTATLCGVAILGGCLIVATPSTTLAQAKTVRPAIVLPPPAPPAPPAPPVAGEPAIAPAPVAVPAVAQAPAPPAPPQAPKAPTPSPAPLPAGTPAPPAPPAPDESDPVYDANIRLDVSISYQAGTAPLVKRSATLVVANNTSLSSLRAGVNVPVPSTTFTPVVAAAGKADGDPRPMTSYNYRSVGLNVDLADARIRRTGSVQLRNLQVEFSAIDEKTVGTNPMPSFPTFSQRFNLTLSSGKPLIVAQSVDVVDGVERKQTVEVKATILPGGEEATPRPKR